MSRSAVPGPAPRRRGVRAAGALVAVSALAAGAPSFASAADAGPADVLGAQPTPPAHAVTPRIAGGDQIDITAAPWQVYLDVSTDDDGDEETCGGSIIDANHIVTAAHCLVGTDGKVLGPDDVSFVLAGSSTIPVFDAARRGAAGRAAAASRADDEDTTQLPTVESIAVHPGYALPTPPIPDRVPLSDTVDDVAVLTLEQQDTNDDDIPDTPALDLSGPAVKALALPDQSGPNPEPGARVFTSGYGVRSDGGTADGNLYGLNTTVFDAAQPEDDGGAGELNALFTQARTPDGSTCQGDSGGGLVRSGVLVGVVSTGATCGANEIGNFTALTAGENLTFVRNALAGSPDGPFPPAPRGGADVTLTTPKAPQVGDALTCSAGTWSAGPAYVYTFTDAKTGAVLQSGPSARYVLVAGDIGRTVSCRATATTPGGVGRTLPTRATAAVTKADDPTPAPGPGPSPSPTPAPRPDPAKLGASVTSGSKRLRQGSRSTFRITVRNSGDVAATDIRICARVGARFSISSRGGATLRGGRLCWTVRSLGGSPTTRQKRVTTVVKRFSLRADRDAKPGRTSAATVSVTAKGLKSASSRRVVTIKRRARAADPGGVTG